MEDMSAAAPRQLAGRREWIGLAVLALPTLLVAMDIGALFLALPHLSADLGLNGAEQLWVTDMYGFMLAGFLITMGTLGDRVGRRRLLLIGAVAFTAASVLAAFSTTGPMLIFARALLGIAGATLSPSTLALISNMFRDQRQQGTAISIWATCLFGGGALGPVVGGVMVQHFWWGSVFLLGVPMMVLLLILGPILLPEYRNPHAGRLDLASVALSLGAVLPIVYGIKEFAASESPNPVVAIGAILIGAVVGTAFLRRQLRLDDPLLDLRLFRQRTIRGALPAMMFASVALAGIGMLSTQWLQSVVGLSPDTAGLWQAPTGIGIAAGTMVAPLLVRRFTPVTTILFGMACSALALLVVTVAGRTDAWLVPVVLAVAIVAFGVGPLFALGTGILVSSAPPERAGSAASLSETSNVFGSTLGLALLGSAGAAVYRNHMADATLPGVPPETAEVARENVAAATAVSEDLPGPAADGLRVAAGEAFTTAMNTVGVIGFVIFIALIVLIWHTFRKRGEAADANPEMAKESEATTSG